MEGSLIVILDESHCNMIDALCLHIFGSSEQGKLYTVKIVTAKNELEREDYLNLSLKTCRLGLPW